MDEFLGEVIHLFRQRYLNIYNMKYIFIVVASLSLFFVSILIYQSVPGSVLPIMVVGTSLLCCLLLHLHYVSRQRDMLKEGNQYFIDAFREIRNPISLIKTPLGVVFEDSCPEPLKKELSIALHNIDGLDQHLTTLMGLKHNFVNSGDMSVAEHEIYAFMQKKVCSLQSSADRLHIRLEIISDFGYASAWFDQGKISPVIDKFILSAIECSLPETHLSIHLSVKDKYWAIRIGDNCNGLFLKCCKWYLLHLPIPKSLHRKQYAMGGELFTRLLDLCNGKILILENEVLLRFPIECAYSQPARPESLKGFDTFLEDEADFVFHKLSKKKSVDGPLVVLVDNDGKFRCYLEKRLSEYFSVRSFDDGMEALESIRDEHPDLVICDIVLQGMGGEELSSKLKSERETSSIPVILLASHIDVELREKRSFSLADMLVYKPFCIEDFKVEISVLISNSRFLRKSFLQKVFGDGFLVKRLSESSEDIDMEFLDGVKNFLLENLDKEDLTIDDIASKMCMSRTTFYNRWKSLTGEAPKYLISRMRMEKARQLLESGNYSVTVVAEMVGMRNLKNFRGRYKEYFGKTPKEYIGKA